MRNEQRVMEDTVMPEDSHGHIMYQSDTMYFLGWGSERRELYRSCMYGVFTLNKSGRSCELEM